MSNMMSVKPHLMKFHYSKITSPCLKSWKWAHLSLITELLTMRLTEKIVIDLPFKIVNHVLKDNIIFAWIQDWAKRMENEGECNFKWCDEG